MWRHWNSRTKRNMLLFGISISLMATVLLLSIYAKAKKEADKSGLETKEIVKEISVQDSLRLFSYFYFDKTEREALDVAGLKQRFALNELPSTYLATLYYGKAIQSEKVFLQLAKAEENQEWLTYGILKILLDATEPYVSSSSFQKISLTGHAETEKVAEADFLLVYELLCSGTSGNIKEKELYVLGEKESLRRDKEPYLITTEGNYFYKGAIASGIKMQDKYYRVLVSNEELIYIVEEKQQSVLLKNVWIKIAKEQSADIFVCGMTKSFATKGKLKQPITSCVADVLVQNGCIQSISLKTETISGKVLKTEQDSLLLEKYGTLYYSDDFRIYKVYGEIEEEAAENILVGYSITEFVLEEGKICAALITESLKADKIRVLIQNDYYSGYYHDSISLTCEGAFWVMQDEQITEYAAGETVVFTKKDWEGQNLFVIRPKEESDKLVLSSIERADGVPSVRGTVEISKETEGLLLINELSLEQYLYAVVPSEMPTYFGSEALKVQAVCARSYAYNQLLANRFHTYGAHVDDSVACQVYNNISENEASIAAVKATYGQVIQYDGKPITAYYFSASCGHTANVEDVWMNAGPAAYLRGKPQNVEEQKVVDLSQETAFRQFLQDTKLLTYDSDSPWYRWTVFLSYEDMTKTVNQTLADRYKVQPEAIRTKTATGSYESIPLSSIGTVKELQVVERGSGGLITKLRIVGTKQTVQIEKEYNIRALLAPMDNAVVRNDGSEVENLTLLPSAFFAFQEGKKEGEKGVWIYGGGNGHGVGMSQTGVRAMAANGHLYDEILKHYYSEVEIGFIY